MDQDVYRIDNMTLKCVSVLFQSAVNSILVCRDISAYSQPYYTLLAVSDREKSKLLLAVFADSERPGEGPAYLRSFMQGDQICFLFRYREKRRLDAFVGGQVVSSRVREQICVNLVLACIESPLPWPLLYLQLDQRLINIEKDNSVFLTTDFDLGALDASLTESDCVVRCADVLLDILRINTGRDLKSFALIKGKAFRKAYAQFAEVYRDIRLTEIPQDKGRVSARVKEAFAKHRDVWFRILLILCVACAAVAIMMLLSFVIFGDFSLSKLFAGSLETIGTEHLGGA
ncbi:MAG: hypothetical protein LBS91_00485 [Clostridiales Family XIII bacterium]|jgi:hypothetical protein|nr:hypothetical protein [Clostridiales Family XIII bacterium]